MEKRALILAIALLATPASAMDGGKGDWFENWYQQEQQQRQRMEQRQQAVEVVIDTRCQKKIRKYQGKLDNELLEDPDKTHYITRYYDWKLGYWTEKCQAESEDD